MGPFNLVVAAWPCQGLSHANRTARGLQDEHSGLFYAALGILRWCQAASPQTDYIFGNVCFMNHPSDEARAAWDVVCSELGEPLICDAALLGPAHRLRAYWHSAGILAQPHPDPQAYLASLLDLGHYPILSPGDMIHRLPTNGAL